MRGQSYRLNTPTLGILSSDNESRNPVTIRAHCCYNGSKSIMKMAVTLVAAIALVADIGHAQTFHKTKIFNGKGKEVLVDLCFDQQSKLLTVKPQKSTIADVPYGAIDKLSYEQAAHRRIMDGGVAGIGCVDTPAGFLTCPASLGVGAVLMLTKGKNRWFYVDYQQDGAPKRLTLKLDKSEYKQVLKTAREQTGKDVEILVSKKGKSPGKK
jgi:hypothetical protein